MSYYDILLAKQLSGGGGGDITVESLSVTANGTYSAPSGKAYSPVTVNVPNPSTGTLNITANGTYDVTEKASAVVNVSGGGSSLIVGALRPDAELIKKYTYDKMIVEEEIATIPSFTSADTNIITASTLDTISIDRETYDYFVVANYLVVPTYNDSTLRTGTEDYDYVVCEYEINTTTPVTLIGGGTASKTQKAYVQSYGLWHICPMYKNSAWSAQAGLSVSYGIREKPKAPEVNSNGDELIIYTSDLAIRGNTSSFPQAAWESVSDVRRQYIIEVYRAKKNDSNVDGFAKGSNYYSRLSFLNNGGTLQ